MHTQNKLTGSILLLLACFGVAGAMPPHGQTAAIPVANNSPTARALGEFRAALKKLGSQEYASRQAGTAALRQALAALMARMIRVAGPERQARIDHLLRYQGDLIRWARVLLHLPLRRRLKLLQWGIAPKMLPLVAGAFSHDQQRQANVAHPLARIPGKNADWLLNRLLNNSHRLVYITAMDAVWNRKPTPAMVKTVWRRAVILGMPFNFQQNIQHTAVFRGQNIPIVNYYNNYWLLVQDGGYATKLLTHWKPRGLSNLTAAVLAHLCRVPPMQSIFNTPYSPTPKDFAKLILLAKPAIVEPYLLLLIHQPISQNFLFNFNNKPGHFSNRTIPLYLLIKLARRNPAAFHFYHTPMYGGVWVTGTVAQEDADTKKITAWFAKRGIKPVTEAQLHHPPVAKPKPPSK